jgi:adenine-specific DNA-methyltransferase
MKKKVHGYGKVRSVRESGVSVTVKTGNALRLIDQLPTESLDLTITSPPYCMGKAYEESTNIADFLDSHKLLLPKIVEKTKDGGSICWQIGYHVNDGVVTPLDFLVHQIMSEFPNIKLRNRVIWHFGHGAHCLERLSGRHEVILWYTKGNDYFFDLDAVRVPQKYPGKKHYKGPKHGQYSCNPKGKNPSDVWEIPNVNAAHVEKTCHPCQFPIGMVLRLILALCPRGGLVFDPFVGSGSTGAASVLAGRSFIGFEKVAQYSQLARQRIKFAMAGKLRFRAADIPVLDPTTAGSVARRPQHFSFEST